MNRTPRLPMVALLLIPIVSAAACRPAQTVERQTNDAAIEARIKAKLATDVGAATITAVDVNVTNGVVTLAGPVKTQAERQKIEAVARGIEGVTTVTNNIQVSAADAAPQPPSTSTSSSTSIPPATPGGPTPVVLTGDQPVFVPFPTPTPVP